MLNAEEMSLEEIQFGVKHRIQDSKKKKGNKVWGSRGGWFDQEQAKTWL